MKGILVLLAAAALLAARACAQQGPPPQAATQPPATPVPTLYTQDPPQAAPVDPPSTPLPVAMLLNMVTSLLYGIGNTLADGAPEPLADFLASAQARLADSLREARGQINAHGSAFEADLNQGYYGGALGPSQQARAGSEGGAAAMPLRDAIAAFSARAALPPPAAPRMAAAAKAPAAAPGSADFAPAQLLKALSEALATESKALAGAVPKPQAGKPGDAASGKKKPAPAAAAGGALPAAERAPGAPAVDARPEAAPAPDPASAAQAGA
ncbi:hypothetical protein Rsub_05720 [Raphidocelis subcapitata]|uniref:Uncharacterized protein n=1 Tax=Raphidocelis subcapitata TaxID=307507 RepID=A0A2V0P0K6_9CHLO|nr:hypothetical protein Rsub_05720 [Raphidocelis subcapitata]|eukprot:GBF93109.1 hypothetical protein Rsub_05720 [Raphidocelis subcapitata]